MNNEYTDQVKILQEEIQELQEQNDRLKVYNQKDLAIMKKELRANQKMLFENEVALQVKSWKSKYENANQTIREMTKQRQTDYRSKQSLQDNWEKKKLQMFIIV